MIQVDVPMAFAIGSLFAGAARQQIQTGLSQRAHLQANLYHLFFFTWVPIYFTVNYFGWETSHMWWQADSVDAYPLFLPVFLIVLAAALNGGFLTGRWLLQRRLVAANRAVYVSLIVWAVGWVSIMREHTFRLGTYREFHAGQAMSIADDRRFVIMFTVTILLWVGALLWFLRRLVQEDRASSARTRP